MIGLENIDFFEYDRLDCSTRQKSAVNRIADNLCKFLLCG
jgi:hypothetical protein